MGRKKDKLEKKTPVSGSAKDIAKALKKEDKVIEKMKDIPKAVSGPKMISTKLIHPNPFNCNSMAPDELKALKEDMKKMNHPSMMDPLRVRVDGKKFEVIDGEHRHKIASELKWPEVSCVIFDMPQDDALLWNFRINSQRGTHDPTKEAAFFKHLKDDLGLTQKRIGELLNLDSSVVSKRISILNIDEDILQNVDIQTTSVSVLEVVAQAPSKKLQKELLKDYKHGYTVNDLQETVNSKKKLIADKEKFDKMIAKAEFPLCPSCGEKAEESWYTKPYVKHATDYQDHIWNPKTGLSKRQEEAKERAVDTGHADQARVLSVFRHMMSPTEIIAKARKNFADFAEVVYNQCDDVKLGFSPHTEDGSWDGDFDAILTDGNFSSPALQITSDQGELQIVLEAKAYGSGELTKVIVSQPNPYEKGGMEKAEKLLSQLIEGKLTFKKLAKMRDKTKKLKLKLPKPLPGMIQPSDKEIYELEAQEVYKSLARFCNHGKHGKVNYSQDALLCGGYGCTECLVQETLIEAGLWGTKAMGDGSVNTEPKDVEYHHLNDQGLPIATKLKLVDKFRKLLENKIGGSSIVHVGGKMHVISTKIVEPDKDDAILPSDIQRQIVIEFQEFLSKAFETGKRGDDLWVTVGKQKFRIELSCVDENGVGMQIPDVKKLRWAPKKKSKKAQAKADEDAKNRKIDGLNKCTAYEDKKYCNGCVNTNKMKKKECWKDPSGSKKKKSASKNKPNSSGVYETPDEELKYLTPDKKGYASIKLTDTKKGWALGYSYGHYIGSLGGQSCGCALRDHPYKTREAAIQQAIQWGMDSQKGLLIAELDPITGAQQANARKLIEWLRFTYTKEVDPTRYMCMCGNTWGKDAVVNTCSVCKKKMKLPKVATGKKMKGVQ